MSALIKSPRGAPAQQSRPNTRTRLATAMTTARMMGRRKRRNSSEPFPASGESPKSRSIKSMLASARERRAVSRGARQDASGDLVVPGSGERALVEDRERRRQLGDQQLLSVRDREHFGFADG